MGLEFLKLLPLLGALIRNIKNFVQMHKEDLLIVVQHTCRSLASWDLSFLRHDFL